MSKYLLTIKSLTNEKTKTFSNYSSAYAGLNKELDNYIEQTIKDFHLSESEKEAYLNETNIRRNNMMGAVPNPKNLDETLYSIYLDKLPREAPIRVINLYDCETNFLAETNAPPEEIEKAIEYRNDLLERDIYINSDFESMQEYLMNKGYILSELGYVDDIESYEW